MYLTLQRSHFHVHMKIHTFRLQSAVGPLSLAAHSAACVNVLLGEDAFGALNLHGALGGGGEQQIAEA